MLLPEETLKQYEVEYEIQPGFIVVMQMKDGELAATPAGQPTKILHAEKEDHFFEKEEDVQVEFTRNDKQAVDGLILNQGGRKMQCKKIK